MSATQSNEENTRFWHLIDGELVRGNDFLEVVNPSNGEVFASAPTADFTLFDKAVTAANRAFLTWGNLPQGERVEYIKAFCKEIRNHVEELSAILTAEQGKPLADSREEISRASAAEELTDIAIPVQTLLENDAQLIELHYRPRGVVGIITPWNAPIHLALGPLVSALYTGNTAILKPSPYTPLTTMKLGEIVQNVFPDGVLNIISGKDELGQWMTESTGISMISFTGSVATGKKVMQSSSATLKRVVMELGGNDPAIILGDVDPLETAKKIVASAFCNSGQVCMAIKRVYVHESLFDAFCDSMVEVVKQITVGDGFDSASQLGPMQNKMQYDKVLDIFEDTKQCGATFIAGGEPHSQNGYFLPPTLVTNIADNSRLVREEQFGPILPILRFSAIDDVVARANDTEYGLGASVWTRDLSLGKDIARRLEAGTTWVNQHRATSFAVPFGGAKQSGYGRQYSSIGLTGYMEPAVININKVN